MNLIERNIVYAKVGGRIQPVLAVVGTYEVKLDFGDRTQRGQIPFRPSFYGRGCSSEFSR